MKNELVLCISLFFIYGPLFSQEGSIIPSDTAFARPVDLTEIIVTASRNDLKMKEIPSSVSIIRLKDIEENNISTLNGVNSMVPNFLMPDYGSKLTSPVYIRGIGSRINNPSVGLYVDNVPYFEKSAFQFDFFDVERIEVLRGPQGTLFGRNSMGGLINIITRSPALYQGDEIRLSGGNFGTFAMSAGHYGKISRKSAFSIAAGYTHNNGFYINEYFGSPVDKLNSYVLRSKLVFNFSDAVNIENTASIEQSLQGGYPYAVFNDSLRTYNEINYNQRSSYNRLMFSDGLNMKYSGENFTITNTVSFQLLDDKQNIDQDFTADSLYFVQQLQDQFMAAEELIGRSAGNKRYEWLTGIFTFTQKANSDVSLDDYLKDMWYRKTYGNTVFGFAFFHQSTLKLTERLSIIAGLRYDHENSGMHYTYDGILRGNLLAPSDTVYPKHKDHIFLPKAALKYSFENGNIYVTYQTGYKAGGFNTTFESRDQLMFRNEKSFNYEAGLKTNLLKDMLFIDIAFFYTRLKNQQIYRTVPSGRGAYLDNAGISENKGFEVTVRNQASRGPELTLSYGYTNSMIIRYKKDSLVNYDGKFTPYIPRHTVSVQLTQAITLTEVRRPDQIVFSILYNHTGKIYWDLNNNLAQGSYGLLNTKISVLMGGLSFDLWFKNITNSNYSSFVFESLGNTYSQSGKPFQFGISGSYSF
jgi:iron complex outermembrane recepter protein